MHRANTINKQPDGIATFHQSRLDDMLERYGECCTQARAGRILGKSARTIHRMLEDGRLRRVGTDVDVRSIVTYLENPYQHDFDAKTRKKRPSSRKRWGSFDVPGR